MKCYPLILCIWVSFSLFCCKPPEVVSEEAALQALAEHKESMYLESVEKGVLNTFLSSFNLVCAARQVSPDLLFEKEKLYQERIQSQQKKISLVAGRLLCSPPSLLQSADLPAGLPRAYRDQILGAERVENPQERFDYLQRVLMAWSDSQKKSIENLCAQLVPEHPYGLIGGATSSPQVDAWMQLNRSQRKARLYVVQTFKKLLEEIEGYKRSYEEPFAKAPWGEPGRWDANDHRYLNLLVHMNLAVEEMLGWIHTEFRPDAGDDYLIAEELMVEQLDFLADDKVDAFVDNIHRSLLDRYSFNESDQHTTAEEVRKNVEANLARSMKLMKVAYRAQLDLIREMMPLRKEYGSFTDSEIASSFDEQTRIIESIFLDDVRFVCHYCDWMPTTESEDNGKLSIPSPAPELIMPSFMLTGTHSESLFRYLYRKAADTQRAYVRKAFHTMCDEGYDMLTGTPFSIEAAETALQMSYIKICMDDAEYAWEQYAASLSALIEPSLSSYWGSGTGNFISSYMCILFENHYNFYNSLLNISKLRAEPED